MKVHLIAESVLRFSPIGIVDNTSTHGNTLHTLLKTATNPGNTPTATSCDDSGVRKTLLSPICGKSIVLLELLLLWVDWGRKKECQMWVREKVTNGPFLVGRCEGLRGKKGLLKNKPFDHLSVCL